MSAGAAALRLDGIACIRGERLLFDGLSLALGPGEAALVGGPNGAGKSSLLRLCAGLLRPAAGAVTVQGRVAWDGEKPALDEERPLADALGFWAGLAGAGAGASAAAMEAMGIARLAPVPVRLLSAGQRRRAALARVLASGAAVWLLDEPGNGLDGEGLDRLAAAISGHRAAGGLAVIATHQPLDLEHTQAIRLGRA